MGRADISRFLVSTCRVEGALFVGALVDCRKQSIASNPPPPTPPLLLYNRPRPAMMAVLLPQSLSTMHPRPQKRRRTATTVLAGYFDHPPQRDVLTSLLNGVGPNKDVEGVEEIRKLQKKKDSRKDKRQSSSAIREPLLDHPLPDAPWVASSSSLSAPPTTQSQPKKKKSFWSAHPGRPNIQIMTMERSVSVTPPPGFSPINVPSDSPTPGPSMSASTSRTSSKRPRTPEDGQDIIKVQPSDSTTPPPQERPPRRKRMAHRKGWKGWIEGSPAPSDKLINLDSAPVLRERRLRSGKNFDAISVGKDSWV